MHLGAVCICRNDKHATPGEQMQPFRSCLLLHAGAVVSQHDLARNLHDMLTQVPAVGVDEDEPMLQSWCGAAEEGVVLPANDADGPRQRKKRKLQEGPSLQVQKAKWASSKLQKKASR